MKFANIYSVLLLSLLFNGSSLVKGAGRSLKGKPSEPPGQTKKFKGREVALDFPNDEPEHDNTPPHGRRIAITGTINGLQYTMLQLEQQEKEECIGFNTRFWKLPSINAPAVYRDCDCFAPYFVYTTDHRLWMDSDCWPPHSTYMCLDGWGEGTAWPCRSYFSEQTWTFVNEGNGYYRIRNDHYGTYLDDYYSYVELDSNNPGCDCQMFTDPDDSNGIQSNFFQSQISAT